MGKETWYECMSHLISNSNKNSMSHVNVANIGTTRTTKPLRKLEIIKESSSPQSWIARYVMCSLCWISSTQHWSWTCGSCTVSCMRRYVEFNFGLSQHKFTVVIYSGWCAVSLINGCADGVRITAASVFTEGTRERCTESFEKVCGTAHSTDSAHRFPHGY